MNALDWLRKVMEPPRHEVRLPAAPSTRSELEIERGKRKNEHERTDKLARMLDDYRRQDAALGR